MTTTKLIPPDGGWGWVVTVASAINYFVIFGVSSSSGILMVAFLEKYNVGRSTITWVSLIAIALSRFLAPLSITLANRYSFRRIVFIGGLFMASGFAFSFFANSVILLILIYSGLVGIGLGLSIFPCCILTTLYFDKRISVANGIYTAGASIGSMVMPLLLDTVLQTYGLQGTLLLIAGVKLQVCVAASLYHPVQWHSKKVLGNQSTLTSSVLPSLPPKLHVIPEKPEPVTDDHFPITEIIGTVMSQQEISQRMLLSPVVLTKYMQDREDSIKDSKQRPQVTVTGRSTSNLRRHVLLSSSFRSTGTADFHISSKDISGQRNGKLGDNIEGLMPYMRPRNLSNNSLSSLPSKLFERSVSETSVGVDTVSLSSHTSSISDILLEGLRNAALPAASPVDHIDRKLVQESSENIEDPQEENRSLSQLSFFCNGYFWVLSFTFGCFFLTFISYALVVPDFVLEELTETVSSKEAALLVTVMSAVDLGCRFCLSWLWDLPYVNRSLVYVITIAMGGCSMIALAFCNTYAAVAVCSAFLGLSTGTSGVILTVLYKDLLGIECFGLAMTVSSFFTGFCVLGSGSFIGVIKDNTGSYRSSFLIIGGIEVCSAFCWCLYSLFKRCKGKKK